MAVTRSTPAQRAATGQRASSPVIRRVQDRPLERLLLLGASLLVLLGLAYVWFAKAEAMRAGESAFDLRQLDRQEQLLPVLQNVLPPGEREYAARQILNFVRDR